MTEYETATIIIGCNATCMEVFAARELQRYLYLISGLVLDIKKDMEGLEGAAFILGQKETNGIILEIAQRGQIDIDMSCPSLEGYILKKALYNNFETLVVVGTGEQGVLYGVYGLLEDYYGIGFYLGGDVIPDTQVRLFMPDVNTKKVPKQSIRGVLPWTNFPQSATVYSYEDYKFIIDQMAKMRMNLLNIHNYNGMCAGRQEHNEMFHNLELDGVMSRTWMATARSGHGWGGPGWDVNEYLFGASDLFDDYDFGSECTLHNSSLSNKEVFCKGMSLFQRVIRYAHHRGIKVALGLEIDLIPSVYKTEADHPEIISQRMKQIVHDYPDIDYLIFYRSEIMEGICEEKWKRIFNEMYDMLKKSIPGTKIAVSGWGLHSDFIADLPEEVIAAPISAYSAGCVSGAEYGQREYWGCPWLERDMKSSQYYYPYYIDLSETINAYRSSASNMKGWQCLTWRITDAVDAKMSYMARAPWDLEDVYKTSWDVYHEYASKNYGTEMAKDITVIINQNEPYANCNSECEFTAHFSGKNRYVDISKASQQLEVINRCIENQKGKGGRFRLELLKCRIEAVRKFCELDEAFMNTTWEELPGAFGEWVKQFVSRVVDISSLGNVQSIQNRWVKERYLEKEGKLRDMQQIKAPYCVSVRGNREGAVITWKKVQEEVIGYNIYRDRYKINTDIIPSNIITFTDHISGIYRYNITSVRSDGQESAMTVAKECCCGNTYAGTPKLIVISPPMTGNENCPISLKVRVLDDRTYESVSARMHYRTLGSDKWEKIEMNRRVKAIFTGEIPEEAVTKRGLEYYIVADNGCTEGYYPETAPVVPITVVVEEQVSTDKPGIPRELSTIGDRRFGWRESSGNIFWYKMFRSLDATFVPSLATYLTYVDKDTNEFEDCEEDFAGKKLSGTYFYSLTAMDKWGNESAPSSSVAVYYD